MKELLTIWMPLKGRADLTTRIMNYAEKVKCPWKIVIADGGHDDLSAVMNPSNYKHLDFEYQRHPFDKDIVAFQNKMADSIGRITTPYTMMIDNDDFFSVEGIKEGLRFLCENRDYAGYRGGINRVKDARIDIDIYHMSSDKTTESTKERFPELFQDIQSSWHDITLTGPLQESMEVCRQTVPEDYQLIHTINRWCAGLHGKLRRNTGAEFYYHIGGRSIIQHNNLYPKYSAWPGTPNYPKTQGVMTALFHHYGKQYGEFHTLEETARIILSTNDKTATGAKGLPQLDKVLKHAKEYMPLIEKVCQFDIRDLEFETPKFEFQQGNPFRIIKTMI